MHKSGTTLVSRILHHSGIEMVDEPVDPTYGRGNQYEREATKQLNKRLLGNHKENSSLVRSPIEPSQIADSVVAKTKSLLDTLSSRNCDWGFKDPRTCLTYDFLSDFLPEHKVVAIFRDPRAVHRHYVNRNRGKLGIGRNALCAWNIYNRLIVDVVKVQKYPTLLVNYDLLMQDDAELQRLDKFICSNTPDQRDARLKRSDNNPGLRFKVDNLIARYYHRIDIFKLYDELLALREFQVSTSLKNVNMPTLSKTEDLS